MPKISSSPSESQGVGKSGDAVTSLATMDGEAADVLSELFSPEPPPPSLPYTERDSGAVVLVDLSSFSSLTIRHGAERIHTILKSLFQPMIDHILDSKGDIVKVLFLPPFFFGLAWLEV
jgi:class 3 adenylate cyclase